MNGRTLSRRLFLAGAAGAAAFPLAGLRPVRASTAKPRRVPTDGIRFAMQTWPQNTSFEDLAAIWQEAEELGLDGAFAFDHLMPIREDPAGPCFEGWTLLSALAAKTERLAVGLLVTANTFRSPALVAKMAATIDHVSGGRLVLGMGAAWFEEEHEAYDITFHTPGGRARRLVEAVEVMKLLFTEKRATYDGKYYRLRNAPFEPKTVQRPHPPILIGGMGPKVIQPLAARHADVWNFRAEDAKAAQAIGKRFDEICAEVGRDSAQVARSVSLRQADLAGASTKDLRERVRTFAGAGIRYFILSLQAPYDRKLLARFAREVIPEVRAA